MSNFQEKKKRRGERFVRQIDVKEKRKEKAERERKISLVYGLGMVGLVGWSVIIPTLIGIALGAWIDSRFPSQYSWTLMLLFIGLILGCLNAWFWVKTMLKIKARKGMQRKDGRANE